MVQPPLKRPVRCLMSHQYFSYTVAVSTVIGGTSQSTYRKPLTMKNRLAHKCVTQFSILVIFQPKTKVFPQNPCFKYFHARTHTR